MTADEINADGEAAPEKLDLRSMDVTEEKKAELLRLFPEARTEGGKIDFDRLKLALGETVDTGRERYGMTWPGKAECFRTIQAPSLATLLPDRGESVNFDTTENLIIEGDNLEVLKLLQKSYIGKVKMIYIDPPYNTGNDFIYPDNYAESLQTYLEYTRQVDTEGRKFGTNTETDGRFHSKWMNMMYPRLYLARNLLRDDGLIVLSCDDSEVSNLRRLCEDIWGEENHFATIAWQKKDTPSNDATGISVTHEYLLAYQRGATFTRNLIPRTDEQIENYANPDADERGPWIRTSLIRKEERDARRFPVTNLAGRVRTPPPGTSWRVSPETFGKYEAEQRIWWGLDGDGDLPFLKRFLTEVQEGVVPVTWWSYQFAGSNRNAKIEMRKLFEGDVPFDTPKPTSLVKRIIEVTSSVAGDDIFLDFFAGSGTSAHAVIDLNESDNGRRKFILVQLPEPTGRDDYKTIADITKERVRRVIKKLDEEDAGKLDLNAGKKQDRGFRVFKLAESNFKSWNADTAKNAEAVAGQLDLHVDHARPGRTQEDLLFEILMKSGYPLTARIETLKLQGKQVFSVADGALLVCLEKELTLEAIRAIAARKPERVVCLDEAFRGNDQLKANAVQIFKSLHRRTGEGESASDVTVFRTV